MFGLLTHFDPGELQAVYLSLKAAFFCTLISIPLAVMIGYVMARTSFWGKSVIEGMIHLPLVMPPVTTGYILLLMLGTNGFLGKLIFQAFEIRLAFTFPAAVIASVFVSFPLIVRSVRVSMEMVDQGLEDASKILGASRIKTFFYITLPLSFPGIISGAILAFARSLGEFGATITFAGNIEGVTRTLPLAIYSSMQIPGQERKTIGLVLISMLISFLAMILSEVFVKKRKKS